MRSLPLDDTLFHGAVSLERRDGYVKPWRIPVNEYALFPPDGIGGTAERPAGVRLGFTSDARAVELHFAPGTEPVTVDCVVEDELIARETAAPGADGVSFGGLPPGASPDGHRRVELYLSQTVPMRLLDCAVDDGASSAPLPPDRPRWITYGSSITHCTGSPGPAETWPAIVARRNRYDLTCLGFGGNCHLEPMVARLIRDLPADFVSLCLGINVQGGGSLSTRTFRPAVIGFVRLVREGHPGTPIAVMSPILSPPRETVRNAAGLSLQDMRKEIQEAVWALRANGDLGVHYVDGLEVFGEAEVSRLPDLLHPDAEGYRLLALNFQHAVVGPVFGGTVPNPAS